MPTQQALNVKQDKEKKDLEKTLYLILEFQA